MKLANEKYDAVYRESKHDPDIENFSLCLKNFKEIKSIIEQKGNPSKLNKFYFEAWISMLYSDVHALNLEPETEDQLNELNEKIQAIGTDFKQLLTKKSNLDPKDESSIKLLKYIDDFKKNWESKKNMLLGHANYNFAEILVEKSSLKMAVDYFTKSNNFYINAANESYKALDKTKLVTFAEQTKARLEEIKTLLLLDDRNCRNSVKKLKIHLQKLPDSITSSWTIINETTLSQASTEKSITTHVIKNSKLSNPTKRRRELHEKSIHPEAKKIKKILLFMN